MKKTVLFAGMFLMFAAVNAQETTPATPQNKPAVSNPTVDSIAAKYTLQAMPEALAIESIFPVIGEYQATASTPAETSTTATTSEEATASAPAANAEVAATVSSIKVVLDAENKGLVWIEGLPQGKVKAMLRKSPSTYKIPAQKTEEGNDVKEGTLIYDKDTKTISVILGKKYNDQDPAASFLPATEEPVVAEAPKAKSTKGKKAVAKKKVKEEKPWVFVGTKVEHTTAAAN